MSYLTAGHSMLICVWSGVWKRLVLIVSSVKIYRRSQDFVWGCTFFLKKVDDLFLVVALKTRSNTTK